MKTQSAAKEVFLEALELDPATREQFLEDRCGTDSGLMAEVAALIGAHDEACDFLGSLPPEDPSSIESPGAVVGRYRLVEKIGEGGFGTVFLAEQREPVVRLVALKIIKAGMDTRHVIARFEAERQALALMDHPNIAKVLDAGATVRGRPYFVMELVSGRPITVYCRDKHVPVAERLRLFMQVCLAVQHAHTKGVIHRDIKPANILIAEQDGRPVARVIDFGVAKATDRRNDLHTTFTDHRHFIGTPEYMSPEQAVGSADIDTRTDVYSLGVVLYELLTGTTPFESSSLRAASYAEVQRIISEDEPPRPSVRLQSGERHARDASETRLGRTVRGELDWIVMKALEKDRTRRYETANDLAEDVRRYLAGVEVLAAPPSATYRVRKLVRRHRAVAAGATIVAIGLSGGLGAALYGLAAARRDRDAAVAAEGRQKAERLSAETVTAFMQSMFEAIDPAVGQGRDTSLLRDMLDKAAKNIEAGELKDSPIAEATLRVRIASAYRTIAQVDAAERMMTGVEELNERTRPGDLAAQEQALTERAAFAKIRRDFEGTRRINSQLIDLRRTLYGDDHFRVADAHADIAAAYFDEGKLPEAQERALLALPLAERSGRDASTANILVHLLSIHHGMSKITEAHDYGERALALFRKVYPGDHPQVARTLTSLVVVKRSVPGREDEAEPLQREAVDMFKRLYPDGHPNLATAVNNLAWLLQARNKSDEAEAFYLEALALERRYGKDRDFSAAQVLINLGQLAFSRGDLALAESRAREAVETSDRAHPEGHYITSFALSDLGRTLRETGRLHESIEVYSRTIEMQTRLLGPQHQYLAISLEGLGDSLIRHGRAADAIAHLRRGLEIRQASKQAAGTVTTQMQLARALSATGIEADAKDAVQVAQAALDTGAAAFKPEDWRLAMGRGILGGARLAAAKLGPEHDRVEGVKGALAEVIPSTEVLLERRATLQRGPRPYILESALARVIACFETLQTLEPEGGHGEALERWNQRLAEVRSEPR